MKYISIDKNRKQFSNVIACSSLGYNVYALQQNYIQNLAQTVRFMTTLTRGI
jgi:hypothetical protein